MMNEKRNRKPRGEEKRNHNLHIRATKSQIDFLDMLSYENEKTKTDIIWKALEFWYNCNKKGF